MRDAALRLFPDLRVGTRRRGRGVGPIHNVDRQLHAAGLGAPALLRVSNSGLRRSLEKWFHAVGVRPPLVGEFYDSAFVNVLALHGLGFMAVSTIVAKEIGDIFGVIGRTEECQQQFYAITPE